MTNRIITTQFSRKGAAVPARSRRAAAINVRLLVISACAVAVIAAGAFAVHRLQKRATVTAARAAGLEAYERGDWNEAVRELWRYMAAHPEDQDILPKLGHALLAAQPPSADNLMRAMRVYRTIIRANPGDDEAFARLTLLYEAAGNYGELGYIAGLRLGAKPGDAAAILAQAKGAVARQRWDEARTLIEELLPRIESTPGQARYHSEACAMLAGLALQEASETGPDEARAYMDRAVAYAPESATALVQRAALTRELAERLTGAEREERLAAVRADLEHAEGLDLSAPPTRLLLAENWVALRELDRAQQHLTALRDVPPEQVREHFGDPADWTVALFTAKARAALLRRDGPAGVALADEVLTTLKGRAQTNRVLPVVVELLVNGGETARAREQFGVLEAAVGGERLPPERAEQMALLDALVATAEGRPYRVIELLEPLASDLRARPLLRTLLAEAYVNTGQTARSVDVLARGGVDPRVGAEAAKLLARSYLERGQWAEARTALAPLKDTPADDAESRVLRLGAELGLATAQQPVDEAALQTLAAQVEELAQAYPEGVEIGAMRATIAEALGRHEEAEAELKRVIAESDDPLRAMLTLAGLYASTERLDAAVRVLRDASTRAPGSAAPWAALADVHLTAHQPEQAAAALREGRAAVSDPVRSRGLGLRLAALQIQNDEAAAGKRLLEELLEENRKARAAGPTAEVARLHVDLLVALLELPDVTLDAARADALLEELKEVEGEATGVQWRFQTARVLLQRPAWRTERAVQDNIQALLRFCSDADPRWVPPVILLGRMHEALGDLDAAEAVYANALKQVDATEIADQLLGLYERQRRFSEARALLERMGTRFAPRALGTRRVLLALGAGETGSAIAELEAQVTRPDRTAMDYVFLASAVYRDQRDVTRALAYLDEAAALAPEMISVVNTRVAILREEGRDEEALRLLDDLVATRPGAAAHLLRGSFYWETERPVEAERDFVALAEVDDTPEGVSLLGEFYARAGRMDDAINAWEKGLARHADAVQLMRGLAKARLMRGTPEDLARVDELLTTLETRLPGDSDVLWVKAVRTARLGTPEAAASVRGILRTAVEALPASAETYRGLASLGFAVQDYAVARDLAARGAELFPADLSLTLLRAQAEFVLGNVDAARRHAADVLTGDPLSVAAHEVLVEVAVRRSDAAALQSTRQSLEALVARQPDNVAAHLLLARNLLALDQAGAAMALLTAFSQTETGRTALPVHLLLGELQRGAGDLAAAEASLAAATALAPEDAGVLRLKLMIAGTRNDYAQAVEIGQALADRADAPHELLVTVVAILASSAEHQEAALALARRAVERMPQNPQSHLALADLLYQRGDVATAHAEYARALELDPQQPDALNNLAWLMTDDDDTENDAQGLEYARQAVTLRPENASFRDTLGYALRKAGRLEEARLEYQRSADLAPPGTVAKARALYHAGTLLIELGERRAALERLRAALAADPEGHAFSEAERGELQALVEGAGGAP
jgi:tetratricopeptide (TPR) repeat protein